METEKTEMKKTNKICLLFTCILKMHSNLENEQFEILALFQNNLSGNSETLSLSGNSGTHKMSESR